MTVKIFKRPSTAAFVASVSLMASCLVGASLNTQFPRTNVRGEISSSHPASVCHASTKRVDQRQGIEEELSDVVCGGEIGNGFVRRRFKGSMLRLRGGATNLWGSPPQPQNQFGGGLFGAQSPQNSPFQPPQQGQGPFGNQSPPPNAQNQSPGGQGFNPFGAFNNQNANQNNNNQQQQQQMPPPSPSLFGGPTQSPNPFSNPAGSTQPQQQQQQQQGGGGNQFGLFGGTSGSSGSGNQNQNQNQAGSQFGLFGNAQNNPPGNNPPNPTSSIFGSPSNQQAGGTAAGSGGGGLFGGGAGNTNPFGGNTAGSGGGGGLFGQPTGGGTGFGFGGAGQGQGDGKQETQNQGTSNPFGGGGIFGGTPAKPSQGLFGNVGPPPGQPSAPAPNPFAGGGPNFQAPNPGAGFAGAGFQPPAPNPGFPGMNFGGQPGGQGGQKGVTSPGAEAAISELNKAKECISTLERALKDGSVFPDGQPSNLPPPPLPAGWLRQWDLTNHAWYYINTNVNPPHVQWFAPVPAEASGGKGGKSAANGTSIGSVVSKVLSALEVLGGGSELFNQPGMVTSNQPGKLLSNMVGGAAGVVFNLGHLLVFVVEVLARALAARGMPLLTQAVGKFLEGGGDWAAQAMKVQGHQLLARRVAAPKAKGREGGRALEPGRFIFMCGGKAEDNSTLASVYVYDAVTGRWEQGPPMQSPRVSARAVFVQGELYVAGGWDGSRVLSSVERLDFDAARWVKVCDMNTPRASPGLTAMDGFLYAAGGFDGQNWLTAVERYDPGTDSWEEVAPLGTPRSAFGLVAVNNSLFAVGGSDGQMSQRTVEKYDAAADRWGAFPGMTTRRENLGVTVAGGQLVAAGGYDSMWAEWLRSSERYDSSVAAWVSEADMGAPRRNCMLVTVKGEVLALGGNNGMQQLDKSERMRLQGGGWRAAVELTLPSKVAYFACVAS